MCPFASLWQGDPSVPCSAAFSPSMPITPCAYHQQQQVPAAVTAAWPQAASCPSTATVWPSQPTVTQHQQQHTLPHSISCDSLVDECSTVSIPDLTQTSSNSSSSDDRASSRSSSELSSASDASTGDLSNSSNSGSSTHSTFQHWQLRRPSLDHDPKLTRRQLRRLGRSWSLADVAKHKYCDDGWIAVNGKVYDITEHLVNHPGWDSGCQVTTVLSIIAHLGTDCSQEFQEIHRPYPVAWKQLQAFYIGDLAQ